MSKPANSKRTGRSKNLAKKTRARSETAHSGVLHFVLRFEWEPVHFEMARPELVQPETGWPDLLLPEEIRSETESSGSLRQFGKESQGSEHSE